MPYATVRDVAERTLHDGSGPALSAVEEAVAAVLLGDAELRIAARVPSLHADVEAGLLDEGAVVAVEAAMVRRALDRSRLPDGVTGMTETVGPYSRQVRYERARDALVLTVDDLTLLGHGGGRAFTVSMA